MRWNNQPRHWKGVMIFLVLLFGVFYLAVYLSPSSDRPSSSRAAPTARVKKYQVTAPPRSTYKYIGNRQTHVYHLPSCPAVKLIDNNNRVYFADRDEARRQKYTECGRCYPGFGG